MTYLPPTAFGEFLLPGHLDDEFEEGTLKDLKVAESFNELLHTIDKRLQCFWVKPEAKTFTDPGRWHIGRFHANPELNAYWVVQAPDGSYCEPQWRHFERLQQMDTWTGRRTYKDFVDARSAKKKKSAAAFADKRREFRELLDERIRHAVGERSSISVPKPVVMENQLHVVEGPKDVLVATSMREAVA